MAKKVREIAREVGQDIGTGIKMAGGFFRRNIRRPKDMARTVQSQFIREKPRVAAEGRTFFNEQGLPISVRNSPNARRIRKQRRQAVDSRKSILDPTFRL